MRTETFPLSLTDQELEQLNYRAGIEGCTVEKLIRWKLGFPKLEPKRVERKTSKTVTDVVEDMERIAKEGTQT